MQSSQHYRRLGEVTNLEVHVGSVHAPRTALFTLVLRHGRRSPLDAVLDCRWVRLLRKDVRKWPLRRCAAEKSNKNHCNLALHIL